MSDGTWYVIGGLADIPLRGARTVRVKGLEIAVFRTADDQVFALEDRCPHKGGPLSEGIVHGAQVTCPLHAWVFDLNTGQAQGADEGAVATFSARVVAGRVQLDATRLVRRSAA